MHDSFKTEKDYQYSVRFFIRWSVAQPGDIRHPEDMGVKFRSVVASCLPAATSKHEVVPDRHRRVV